MLSVLLLIYMSVMAKLRRELKHFDSHGMNEELKLVLSLQWIIGLVIAMLTLCSIVNAIYYTCFTDKEKNACQL